MDRDGRHRSRNLLRRARECAVWLAPLTLNALLVVGDFIETPWALVPAQISFELVALVVAGWVVYRLRGGAGSGAVWCVTAALVAVLLLRIADIMVPWFFGRAFNAAVDLKYLPFFLGLLEDSLPPAAFAAYLAAAFGTLAATIALVAGLVWALGRALGERRVAPFALAVVAPLIAFALVPSRYDLGPLPVSGAAADVASRNLRHWLDATGLAGEHAAVVKRAIAALPPAAALDRLGGRNVLLIFAESYGAITLADPEFRAALVPLRERFAARARAAGYHVHSDVINSPISGGGSWLAHATMLTGIRIDSQPLYDVMLASQARTLASYFRDAGYRTIAVMPRLQQPWPHGAFFGFDAVLDDAALAYRGPRFTWETTPDQFVLERVHAREIASRDRPLFLKYVLSSSHLPFDHVPPVVPDGRSIGDGAIFAALEARRFPPPGGQVFENRAGYLAAIGYVLEVLENYLVERLDDDALVIVIGDHQPPLTAAAASRNKAVPIHVFSRDPALVEPFRRAGFAPGLVPARVTTDIGMESFLPWLIESFATPAAGS